MYGRCPCLSVVSGVSRHCWRGHIADRARYSHDPSRSLSRSAAILMGRDRLTVKTVGLAYVGSTQHLPLKTPGQTRCRCSRMPGLMRVREQFGRPFPVAVGQWWARSGLVSGSGTGAPGIGCPESRSIEPISRSAFSQVTDASPGLGRGVRSTCVRLSPAVARTYDGRDFGRPRGLLRASRGPSAGPGTCCICWLAIWPQPGMQSGRPAVGKRDPGICSHGG